ncbi:MAG: CoA transferase, partial [Proteobacteria bacterium]|nr:CoA transferase [Pseudomonadota bacterium]
ARPGLDLIAQGWSGLMSITGEGPGRPPVKIGAPVSDTTAGMLLALGLVAAYVHRLKTGEGQRVETSLIEAAMAHTHWQAAIFLAEGKSAAPMGSAHPLSAPYQAFRCADGYLIVGAPSQTLWQRLVEALGEPVLRDDARFHDNAARRKNLGVLVKKLSAVFVTRTRAAWIERLDTAGVPCGPVNTLGETLTHPHAKARDMVIEVAHARAGRVKALGCPLKFSGTPASTAKAAPSYGEDSVAVLRECGFAADEIDALLRDGAVAGDANAKTAAQ